MRRRIVALMLCSLAVGLSTVIVLTAASTDDAVELVTITVRGAEIPDVLQKMARDSGFSIVCGASVRGHIDLDEQNVPVERVLEKICGAKGYYWWRDDGGIYYVSAEPRPAPRPRAAALPPMAAPRDPEKTWRTYTLQYLPPQHISYLFGGCDDPGPMALGAGLGDVGGALMQPLAPRAVGPLRGGLGEFQAMGGGGRGGGGGGRGGGGGGRGGGGGGGGRGGGGGLGGGGGSSLIALLPEGVEPPIAYPVLNMLLIQGTEEGINEFIELLKILDRKPQQIIVEIQEVVVSQAVQKQMGLDWFYIAGNTTITPQGMATAASIIVGYNPPGRANFKATLYYLLEKGYGRVTSAIRVATMNLLPAYNAISVQYPWVQVGGISGDPFRGTNIQTLNVTTYPIISSLYIVPRINGDGTITLSVPYTKSNITGTIAVPTQFGSIEYPIITTNVLQTTVNVRDGETFVVGGGVDKSTTTSIRKLPILGDIPLIGDLLFTRKTSGVNESETLLFITPRIIKEEAAPATLGPI